MSSDRPDGIWAGGLGELLRTLWAEEWQEVRDLQHRLEQAREPLERREIEARLEQVRRTYREKRREAEQSLFTKS